MVLVPVTVQAMAAAVHPLMVPVLAMVMVALVQVPQAALVPVPQVLVEQATAAAQASAVLEASKTSVYKLCTRGRFRISPAFLF
jgi:hypothetical protein